MWCTYVQDLAGYCLDFTILKARWPGLDGGKMVVELEDENKQTQHVHPWLWNLV